MNTTHRQFPHVQIFPRKKGVEGMAGIAMKSLLKGDLLMGNLTIGSERNYLDRLSPNFLHQARKSMLAALSCWSSSPVLELRICAFPNLQHRAQSRITITLCLRVRGKNEEVVKEKIFSHYLALLPLLQSHLPEAEFVPVVNEYDLKQRLANECFNSALAVSRQKENIELTIPVGGKKSIGFGNSSADNEIALVADHIYPWYQAKNDFSRLLNTMMGQLDPVQILVRLQPAQIGKRAVERLGENIKKCEMYLAGSEERQFTLKRQAEALRDVSIVQQFRLKETSFKLGVFVLSSGEADSTLAHVLGQAITERRFDGENENLMMGGFAVRAVPVSTVEKMSYFSEEEPVTATEAACCFRLPSPPTEMIAGLPIRFHRTSLALLPDGSLRNDRDAIKLFDNVHQGMRQPVQMGLSDRLRHIFILGQTGTGKSCFMESSLILQDIRAGRGVGVIDPHGELVDSIIGRIPAERVEDVVLFDLLDRERPVGFNLLEWHTDEERDLVIDELYLTLDRIYDMKTTGGPIFEQNFRGMLGLLLGDKPRENFIATLLDFIPCYQNRNFRKWLMESIDDPHILDFLEELENTGGDARLNNVSPYITSKLSRFVNDKTLQRIVGQSKTTFDIDKVINEGKIFLIKLGKGRFGSNISALIANQLVSRFKLAAMKRGEMKPEDRREFFLYVDEAHNLPGENFMELLSEARKYKMGLVLATQYMAQLRGGIGRQDDLLSAIIGNVGTTLTFRLGQEDAENLAPTLHPTFNANDISGLPNFQGYAKMQLRNEATQPFSFMTFRDESAYDSKVAEKIRKLSRLKYGQEAKLVDEQIKKRRVAWKDE